MPYTSSASASNVPEPVFRRGWFLRNLAASAERTHRPLLRERWSSNRRFLVSEFLPTVQVSCDDFPWARISQANLARFFGSTLNREVVTTAARQDDYAASHEMASIWLSLDTSQRYRLSHRFSSEYANSHMLIGRAPWWQGAWIGDLLAKYPFLGGRHFLDSGVVLCNSWVAKRDLWTPAGGCNESLWPGYNNWLNRSQIQMWTIYVALGEMIPRRDFKSLRPAQLTL